MWGFVVIGLLLGSSTATGTTTAAGAERVGADLASERVIASRSNEVALIREDEDISERGGAEVMWTPAVQPPARVRPTLWYRLAADTYEISPVLLEALHQVESSASPDSCIVNREGSGAMGPFQFKPATFAQVGVDANDDGIVDICGFADSLFSAGRYLRILGADGDPESSATRSALRRYGTDAQRVIELVSVYRERDGHRTLALEAQPQEESI